MLCDALQALWCDAETRNEGLDLIRKSHSERVNGANGRPGMDVWQILVFAVMKPGLDIDFDRLANLASNHRDLRSLAGLSHVLDPSPMSAATLANTMSLLTDDVLARINHAIVQLGHQAVGHSPGIECPDKVDHRWAIAAKADTVAETLGLVQP